MIKSKHEVTDIIEHNGIEYEFEAIIYDVDEGYNREDEIISLQRTDGKEMSNAERDRIESVVLDYANSQIIGYY